MNCFMTSASIIMIIIIMMILLPGILKFYVEILTLRLMCKRYLNGGEI